MARFSALLGRRVEVHYRAGDICLPASGTLVADSGRSIYLEQHYEQNGQQKNFRWELPYQSIINIQASIAQSDPATAISAPAPSAQEKPVAASAAASGGTVILPFPRRPKTA